MADPYDPAQNAPYRMHDVSLYKGRFYLYFGAAPAVTLLLPFRLLTHLRMPENLAVAIFFYFGLVASYFSFEFVLRRFAPNSPRYFSFVAIALFGFCNFAPYILRRPAFYELAIAGGYFFFWAAVYFLLTGLAGQRTVLLRLAAAGMCLGLTLASRPNYAIAVTVSLASAVGALLLMKKASSLLKSVLAIGVPFACVVMILLGYNYFRFDNVFEFGQRFQMESFPMGKTFSPAYFAHNFRAYIFSTARIDRHFPFFHLLKQRAQIYSNDYGEAIGGMLPTAPLTLLVFLLIPLSLYWMNGRQTNNRSRPLVILALLFGLNGMLMVTFLSFNGGLTERYVLDFLPSFLFSAVLIWVVLHQELEKRITHRRALSALLALLVAFQVTLNLAVSLTGYYDNFHEENPETYEKIHSVFSFIEP
jgi:hypothetical protein